MSESTVNKTLRRVSKAFIKRFEQHIRLPQEDEVIANAAYCFKRYGIRGIGGAMDGTHFAIANVEPAVKMSYMNQKEGSTAVLAHIVCSNIDG